jgi:hypothetical protein
MPVDVNREMAALERMTLAELRSRYAELFDEPTRSRHRQSLMRRVVWRLQALAEGDLSERARRRAKELANDADLRLSPPGPRHLPPSIPSSSAATRSMSAGNGLPAPGTILTRLYKGRLLEVTVLTDGFAYRGERFATLSAVAKHITGSHWNGHLFFGLTQKGTK